MPGTTVKDVEQVIVEVLRSNLDLPSGFPIPTDVDILGPNRHSLGGVEVDSLAEVELVVELSARFTLTLDQLPPQAMSSISALATYIRSELARTGLQPLE